MLASSTASHYPVDPDLHHLHTSALSRCVQFSHGPYGLAPRFRWVSTEPAMPNLKKAASAAILRRAIQKSWPHEKNPMSKERVFLSPPHMCGEELGFVHEAFESNYIAPLGPQVNAFEEEFSDHVGLKHCVALSSGSGSASLAHFGSKPMCAIFPWNHMHWRPDSDGRRLNQRCYPELGNHINCSPMKRTL